MGVTSQVIGVPLLASASAAAGSAAGGAIAIALGVCDPKFGCTFGLQFGAGMAAIVGFLLGILLLCALAGYTAVTKRLVDQRPSLFLAVLLGLLLGVAWSAIAAATYV